MRRDCNKINFRQGMRRDLQPLNDIQLFAILRSARIPFLAVHHSHQQNKVGRTKKWNHFQRNLKEALESYTLHIEKKGVNV